MVPKLLQTTFQGILGTKVELEKLATNAVSSIHSKVLSWDATVLMRQLSQNNPCMSRVILQTPTATAPACQHKEITDYHLVHF